MRYTCCEYATKELIHMYPETLTAYLKEEIRPQELSELLDEHLNNMIQLTASAGEPISEDQASAYHHIRRLRDLFAEMEQPTMQAIHHETAIA